MSELVRLSISLEEPLARQLEKMVSDRGYSNRSEFIRDMVRQNLVEQEWASGASEVVGTITMIYDHARRELSAKLTDIQHHHHHTVLAATHVHLDHHLCAEMVMMKGSASEIRQIADQLSQQKGVLHAALSISSTGKNLH